MTSDEQRPEQPRPEQQRPEQSRPESSGDGEGLRDVTPDAVPDAVPDPVPEADPHRPDGLDLARAAARAAAALPGAAPVRRRKPGGGPRRRTWSTSSGAHPDDRDPQLLESAMDRLVASHGWELDLKVQGVFGRWAELVGEDVAAHCTPEAFADGRLVVRTDSTAWATQLKLLAPAVVRRLNTELGHGTVTVIEVLGPHLPSWKKGRFGTRDGRGPRDTYG
ncbi:MAG: Zn-ribbon-containing, possibly RNA-binding protein and truncated derivatives [uncultured Nocardioides sp.]|uniref:Zn-ribbon-containing, possibly RNA-binding protein and truncated derivatives n=1 Tax=uncultured Nocardioides sp. TaxID=198441 RepID=A0A6J4NB28_9ACTN|nr:MAG: Zn-ribbon-containing, possibly RNA-binding protein and truncated derivatives [uncultured Nocardioides sp.]